MKLKHLGIFLLLSTMAVFSACSDDDDDKDVVDLATEVKGDYKGDLSVTVGDADPVKSENTIALVRTGKDKVQLELNGFTIPDLGEDKINIVLKDIELEGKSGDVKIKKNEQDIVSLAAKVTTTGTIKGKVMDLALDINVGEGGLLKVIVTFADGKLVVAEK